MSRKKKNLPLGDRPITNVGVVRTRYTDDFETRGPLGHFKGQFYALVQKIGVDLELPAGSAPKLVMRQPIYGRYAGGKRTQFRIHRVSLFTNTSKMPGPSFAIPAGPPAFGGTCPASALGENMKRARTILQHQLDEDSSGPQAKPRVTLRVIPAETLGDAEGLMPSSLKADYTNDPAFVCRGCYALGGNYNYPSKQANDMAHHAWCDFVLATKGSAMLGKMLAMAIHHINVTRKEGFQPYFRIHDAGDFYSKEYLDAWVECAVLMPHMRFWAPTRQWVFPKWVAWLKEAQARVREAGGMLTIRPSVLRVGDPVPVIPGLDAGSGVDAHHNDPCIWLCPVYNKVIEDPTTEGGRREAVSCLEAQCTMCWDQPGLAVTYANH